MPLPRTRCVSAFGMVLYAVGVGDLSVLTIGLLVIAGIVALLVISNALLWLAAVVFPRLERYVRRNEARHEARRPERTPPTAPRLDAPRPGSSTVAASRLTAAEPACNDIGVIATTLTPMRPSGVIDLAGRRRDAESITGYIERGSTVTVRGQRGDTLLVQPKPGGGDA